jgi:hypothetical protein
MCGPLKQAHLLRNVPHTTKEQTISETKGIAGPFTISR